MGNGYIENIISLQSCMFKITTVPVYLLVFSRDNETINMIDASEYVESIRKIRVLTDKDINEIGSVVGKESEISQFVSKEDIKAKDYY